MRRREIPRGARGDTARRPCRRSRGCAPPGPCRCPGSRAARPASSRASSCGWLETMSAPFRYARILNGLSALISSRSAISARMRAMAALSNAEPFHLDPVVEHPRAARGERRRDGRPRAAAGRSRRGIRRRRRRTPWRPSRRPPSPARSGRRSRASSRRARGACGSPTRWRSAARPRPSRRARAPRAWRGGRVADALEAVEDVTVAVDVALDDLPVVRARVARRAGVGEDDPLLELRRVDVEGDAPDAVDAELDGARRRRRARAGSPARRSGTRIVWHSTFMATSSRRSRSAHGSAQLRQRAADRDRQRRRSGDAGAGGRLAARGQRRVLQLEMARQQGEQRQVAVRRQLAPVAGVARCGPCRSTRARSGRRSRALDLGVRAQADGGVERGRAGVKQVEGPDVDGAAGQVDAGRRGRDDAHGGIIPGRSRPRAGRPVRWCPTVESWTRMSPGSLRREIGQLLIAGFDGPQLPGRAEGARPRVRPGRRHPVRAQRRRARAGGGAGVRGGPAGARPAALGERRPGRRPRRAAQVAVHRVAADGDARPQRRRRAGRAIRPRARRRSCGRSASRSTTRRCSTSTPTRRTRSSATARWPTGPTEVARLGAAIVTALQAGGRGGLRQAFSRPRRHDHRLAPRAAARRAPARAAARGGVRAVPGGHRGRRRDDHDGARARAGARRGAAGHAVARASSRGCCARSWASTGVILSDDLEMKAIASDVPRAGGGRAGDRGGLRRRARSAAATTPRRRRRSKRSCTPSKTSGCRSSRVDDALRRQQRAKERFLCGGRPPPGRLRARALRAGPWPRRARAVADEMARFA